MKCHSDFWGGGGGGRTAVCRVVGAGPGQASLGQLQEHGLPGRQVGDVPRARQLVRDVLGGLQLAQLDEAIARGGERVGDQLGGLGVALSGDDGRLLLLLSLGQWRRGREQDHTLGCWMAGGSLGRTRPHTLTGSRRNSGTRPPPPPETGSTSTVHPTLLFPAMRCPLPVVVGTHFCWLRKYLSYFKVLINVNSNPAQPPYSVPGGGKQEREKR